MANEPEKQPETSRPAVTGRDVAQYLRRHPDFLVRNPELLRVLTPPSHQRGDSVVDMQQFMVERQRREIERLRESYQELIEISRGNLSTQSRIHAGVLSLLSARTFEHLIDIVTHELAHTLGADAVTLGVEGEQRNLPRSFKGVVFVLRPGQIDGLLGPEHDVLLRPDPHGDTEVVFGPAAGIIRSDALLRLRISKMAPQCLLAIGSRRADYFHPRQGTELLSFLSRALEYNFRMWLDLPKPA